MRVAALILVVLVFGAAWLFDTRALLELTWLCLTGQCGVPTVWVASGLGLLALACVLPGLAARWRAAGRRRSGGARPRAKIRKPGKQGKLGKPGKTGKSSLPKSAPRKRPKS